MAAEAECDAVWEARVMPEEVALEPEPDEVLVPVPEVALEPPEEAL